MSILIKGMEMPESCYYCPFSDGSWGYSPPNKKRCLISGKDMPVDDRGVQSNQLVCPLVPVPPHGRLIDADALYESCAIDTNIDVMASAKRINEYMQLKIDEAPTIIPSEEE